MYLNRTRSNFNSLISTYRITYENVGNHLEYLSTCIHPKFSNVWHSGGSARERVGQLEQMSLFALIVNYWFRTLYYNTPDQMMLLQCLNVTPFLLLLFSQTLQIFAISMTSNGMQGTESRGLAC